MVAPSRESPSVINPLPRFLATAIPWQRDSPSNCAGDGVIVGIQNNDLSAVRYVNAAGGRINRNVIVILAATCGWRQGNRLEQMVAGRCRIRPGVGARQKTSAEQCQKKTRRNTADHRKLHGNAPFMWCDERFGNANGNSAHASALRAKIGTCQYLCASPFFHPDRREGRSEIRLASLELLFQSPELRKL